MTGISVSSSSTGEVEASGDLVGGTLVPASLTTGLTDIEMIPVTPRHLNVYIDPTHTAFGTTQVKGNFSADWSVSDRASAVFFHGREIPGIADFVEGDGIGAEANLTQKDDDLVDELLVALDNGQRRFIRYEFLGPEIGTTGIRNRIIIDSAAQIGDSDSESDEDGVFAIELPYRLQHSGAWGRPFQIKVRNGLGSL